MDEYEVFAMGNHGWKLWHYFTAAVFFQRFLSIRQKTFDDIEQYLKQLIYIHLLHTRSTISSCQHSWFTSLSPQSGKVKSN